MNAQLNQPTTYSEELLSDLVHLSEQTLLKHGVEANAARAAAFEATEEFRHRWGGLIVYIPKGHDSALLKRNLQIWQCFNGHNQDDLAREHDLSVKQIYQVVRRVRRAQQRLRQRDIFDDEAGKGG